MSEKQTETKTATVEKKVERCPRGKSGHTVVVDGVCYECEGDEAARRARNDENGYFGW